MGVHSVGACLHLKQWEGQLRLGKGIRPVSVLADTADLIHSPASERARKAGANRWISADPVDVENWANLVIAFDDGSRGNIVVSDVGLGGLNTRVTAFMTDGVIKANMTSNDAIETYAPDAVGVSKRIFHGKARDEGGLEPSELRRGLVSWLCAGDRGFRRRNPRGPGTALRH